MNKGMSLEDQVVSYVRRAAAVRGHGVLGRGHEAAGLSSAYLRSMPAGAVGLGRVRAIVEGCEMDPSEVVRHALDTGAVSRFVADGRRLAPHTKDFPSAVHDTVYRMRAWWEEQDVGVNLDAIDAQRYEDPQAALRAISDALGVVSGPKTYARALGIWGSAQAGVYRLDYATMGIGLAIEAAQAAGDRKLLAVLLQRAAYALRDRGELDWSLGISDAMLELRASLHDLDGMGRAFVVHGSLLSSAGDPATSLRCSRAALSLLDEESKSWRFFAHKHQSLAYLSQGKLERAEAFARLACDIGVTASDLVGRLAWVRGRIAHRNADLEGAVTFYREAMDLLEFEVVDAGLVGAELVRVLLESGKARAAHGLAAHLSSVADAVTEHPLDFDQAISAALLDLALAGLQAKASVALVSRVVEAIDRGQATATARLRRDLRL